MRHFRAPQRSKGAQNGGKLVPISPQMVVRTYKDRGKPFQLITKSLKIRKSTMMRELSKNIIFFVKIKIAYNRKTRTTEEKL